MTETQDNGASVPPDRARGVMVGLAVGNLFGIVHEGWSRQSIAHRYPDGIREITAKPGYPDDDDIAQAIALAEAAAEGPLDLDDVGRRFWDWAEINGAGMGGLTGRVLSLYGGSHPQRLMRNRRTGRAREPIGTSIEEASRTAWENSRYRGDAGNGAVMRCAPIAIRWHQDPLALARNSYLSAVPTHWDRRCGWSCVVLNVAIASALRGEWVPANELLQASLEGVRSSLPELERYGVENRVPRRVRDTVTAARKDEMDELYLDGPSMGYTLRTLRAAVVSHWSAPSFERGLREVIEAGGDTDTNGAAAGAVLGARFGVEGIPSRWREQLAELRAGRTPMAVYADRLLAAAATD